MAKIKDLRKKSEKDLNKMVQDIREEIAQTGIDAKTAKENNIRKTRNLRKDLARVLSLLDEKSREETAATETPAKKEDK